MLLQYLGCAASQVSRAVSEFDLPRILLTTTEWLWSV